MIAFSRRLEFSLPFADPALPILLPSLPLFHALALLHLPHNHLELLHDATRSLHRGRDATLVRPELFELGRKELRLDILRSAIEQQQVGHVVVLDLKLSVRCGVEIDVPSP